MDVEGGKVAFFFPTCFCEQFGQIFLMPKCMMNAKKLSEDVSTVEMFFLGSRVQSTVEMFFLGSRVEVPATEVTLLDFFKIYHVNSFQST